MRIQAVLLALSMLASSFGYAQPDENSAVSDPEAVLEPPLSWVCLNPQTRRFEVIKAATLLEARQSVNGDDTTRCDSVPAALDPEKVAFELNER